MRTRAGSTTRRRVARRAVTLGCLALLTVSAALAGGAVSALPAAAAVHAAPAGTDCLSQAVTSVCEVSSGTDPIMLTVPPGLTRATVVLVGGQGGNGDFGALGGAGGMVVAELPLVPGHQLAVFRGTGANGMSPGGGWKAGGAGARTSGAAAASGGGGGATAVFDASTGSPLAVAGGGGGAGGGVNVVDHGGNGGAAGSPGTSGSPGSTSPGSPVGKHGEKEGGPGPGGCADGRSTSYASADGCASGGAQGHDGGSGGNGGDNAGIIGIAGGGGGAGWVGGDGGDQAVLDPLPAGGGGGGAGSSYVAPGGRMIASAAAATFQGFVRFTPAGAVTTVACTPGSASTTYRVPAGVTSLFAVVAGGSGNTANGSSPAPGGGGAVGSGTVAVRPGDRLTLTAGCEGLTGPTPRAQGGGGGKGYDSFPHTGYDGGAAGSPGYLSGPGVDYLVAGGGGGGGGQGWDSLYNQKPSTAGAGGVAGLGWGPQGAGNGKASCTANDTDGISGCADPTKGGTGAASGQRNGNGDRGSDGGDGLDASGGGGGGGAGVRGGTGGDGGSAGGFRDTHSGSGGGGGAGSSGYGSGVTEPLIGVNTEAEGFVTVVTQPSRPVGNGPNNVGIAVPGSQPTNAGFDGSGNVYDIAAMTRAKAGPGATLPAWTPIPSISYTARVPDSAADGTDDWTPAGQTIPIRRGGVTGSPHSTIPAIAVLGAASYGPATITAQVIFSNTVRTVTISLPDWTSPRSRQDLKTLVTVPRADTGTTSLYAQLIPVPVLGPSNAGPPLALRLPRQSGSATSPTVHIFDVAGP